MPIIRTITLQDIMEDPSLDGLTALRHAISTLAKGAVQRAIQGVGHIAHAMRSGNRFYFNRITGQYTHHGLSPMPSAASFRGHAAPDGRAVPLWKIPLPDALMPPFLRGVSHPQPMMEDPDRPQNLGVRGNANTGFYVAEAESARVQMLSALPAIVVAHAPWSVQAAHLPIATDADHSVMSARTAYKGSSYTHRNLQATVGELLPPPFFPTSANRASYKESASTPSSIVGGGGVSFITSLPPAASLPNRAMRIPTSMQTIARGTNLYSIAHAPRVKGLAQFSAPLRPLATTQAQALAEAAVAAVRPPLFHSSVAGLPHSVPWRPALSSLGSGNPQLDAFRAEVAAPPALPRGRQAAIAANPLDQPGNKQVQVHVHIAGGLIREWHVHHAHSAQSKRQIEKALTEALRAALADAQIR